MDAQPVLALITAATQNSTSVVLVGVGGHGGAGKTTLAGLIPGAQIVATDEFWDGEGFDIERLSREVVTPLSHGQAAQFTSYDWATREQRGSRTIEPSGVVIIEGVCALHRTLRSAYAVRVWVEAPYDLRLERGVARDGEDARATWVDVWMPSEDRYIERDDPISSADVIVDGSDGSEGEI